MSRVSFADPVKFHRKIVRYEETLVKGILYIYVFNHDYVV